MSQQEAKLGFRLLLFYTGGNTYGLYEAHANNL